MAFLVGSPIQCTTGRDYSFRSDSKGTGKYTAMISNAELEKWQMVEVAYHPGGDAKDMKNMQIALSAPIKIASK